MKQVREGTGEWFLQREDFQKWASNKQCMLWCPGIPGAGKTFIASLAVNYLKRERKGQNDIVLVVYCGLNDAKSDLITSLIAALVKQILQTRSDVSDELKKEYKESSRTDIPPSLSSLTRILRAEIAKFDKCFIIVDALDEIAEEAQRGLLLENLMHKNVNTMVTSRPLDTIRDLFEPYTDLHCDSCEKESLRFVNYCKQCLDRNFQLCETCYSQEQNCSREGHQVVKSIGTYEIWIEATESDITNYVQWRINHESKLLNNVNKKRSLRDEIKWTIIQQANGM